MGRLFINFINYIFLFLSAIICATLVVSISTGISSGILGIVIAILLIAGFIVFLYYVDSLFSGAKKIGNRLLSNVSVFKLGLLLFVFSFLTKITCTFLFRNDSYLHSDMNMYLSFANQIASDGIVSDNAEYAVAHGYTFFYGLFLSIVPKLFGTDSVFFSIWLSLLVSVGIVLLFDILRKFADKKVVFLGLLLYCVLPMGMLQTQLVVHEDGLLIFHILSFWFFIKALYSQCSSCKKAVMLFFSAVCISFGSKMNPTGLVVIVAYLIFSFLYVFRKKFSLRSILAFLSVIAIFALSYCIVSVSCNIAYDNMIDRSKITSNVGKGYALSNGWGLYVGYNYDSNGQIADGDAEKYFAYRQMESKEEAHRYQKNLLSERFNLYREEPYKIPVLWFNKTKVLWGTPWLPFAYEQGNSVSDIVYHGCGGLIYKALLLGNMLIFLLVFFINAFSNKRIKKYEQIHMLPCLHCKLVIIGVTIPLVLIMEVTAKYSSHLQILMFIIFILNYSNFLDNSKKMKNRFSRLKRKKENGNI